MDIKNALIVGAGIAGQELLEELLRKKLKSLKIVGFVDDDLAKENKTINSVPVIGKIKDLSSIVKKFDIKEVFIAIPSAKGSVVRKVILECQKENVVFRIIPRLLEIVEGKVKLSQVRQAKIEDLLGRAILHSDQKLLKKYFSGKKILVTGAGGSIGFELCKQLILSKPSLLVGFDWRENALHETQRILKELAPDGNVEMIVGSIQDSNKVGHVFEKYKPDIVFHAAAFKHVSMMQNSPEEAVKNNILGTKTVAEYASFYKVEKFVNISTDKAVNPTSIMGASKSIAEKIVGSFDKKNATRFSSVRFGNVLGSEGSVVPIFEKQIANGGPVTVTDERMTRYFMTISEAVHLVLHASILSQGGEIFMLDMGEPIKIIRLAKSMIKLAGYIPDEEIKIKIVGRKLGEKLSEELNLDKEKLEPTSHDRIYKIKAVDFSEKNLEHMLKSLKEVSEKNDIGSVYDAFREIFPSIQDIGIPITRPYVDNEDVEAVTRVVKSGWMTMGSETANFEKEFAKYVGANYAIAVNSCTSALFLSLKALGIKKGDEIIVPSFTFASSVSVITHVGAVPVFADIDPSQGFVMTQKTFEKALTKKTKAVIPVHYAGNRSQIETKLPIIEDSAHFIPKKGDNKHAFAKCYSFYATKNITTGEGGMITVQNKKIYEWLMKARLHGLSKDAWKRYDFKSKWTYTVEFPGYKLNTTDINSALGRTQLSKLDFFEKKRRKVVNTYNQILGLNNSGTHLYPVLVEDRNEFFNYMKKNRVGCSFHFTPLHLEPAFKKYSKASLPNTEFVGSRVATLPLDAVLSDEEVRRVAFLVKNFGIIKNE